MPHWDTLLLEAGPDENEISDVPSLAAYLQLTDLDWQYKTEPTGKACLGMKVGILSLGALLVTRGTTPPWGSPGAGRAQAVPHCCAEL